MSLTVLQRTADFLDASGLIDGYTRLYHRWYDGQLASGESLVLFRHTGDGASDVFKQEYDLTITLLAGGMDDIDQLEMDAQAIVQKFRSTDTTTGVIKFDMLGNAQGPFYLEDDRPLYQINVRVFTEDQ